MTPGQKYAVVLVVLFAGHLYLWSRLSDVLGVAPRWGTAAATLAGCALAGIAGLVALRYRALVAYRWARWIVSAWVAFFSYVLMFAAGGHVLDALGRAVGLWSGIEATGWMLAVPLGLAVVITLLGLVDAARAPWVRSLAVDLHDLPEAAEGLRVVQLSDVHISRVLRIESVRAIVEQVNALEPDLLVMTGDLVDEVDERCPPLPRFIDEIARLRARLGTLAVLGNHEVCTARPHQAIAHLRRAGFTVLGNEGVEPVPGLLVIGLNDIEAQCTPFRELHAPPDDFPKLLAAGPGVRTKVLLYHKPVFVDRIAELGVDLMLAGHTHGGQLWPFGHWSKWTYQYLSGLHRVGGLVLHVCPGVGCAGPPLRVGAPREITVLTLRRART
jgi:predicted MPP superfamily phosphohydrolase